MKIPKAKRQKAKITEKESGESTIPGESAQNNAETQLKFAPGA
jgi:hypothetical protein